ncbi:MAG: glycosyltransferase family 39 protein [Anaerolineae bacterium]|nr:glycosyltransferase family 39 protein [Anaerolineae bacterium]
MYLILQPLDFHLSWATAVDDTFYYLGWARNLALGNGPTFDGVIFTNGVQPLWAVILTLLARLSAESLTLLRLALGAAALFNVAALLAFWRVLRQVFTESAALVGALLFASLLSVSNVFLSGMENSLHLFLSALVMRAYLSVFRSGEPRPAALFMLGAALGMTFLCRVDSLVLAAVLVASLWIRFRGRIAWRNVALFVLGPVIAVASLYAALNLAQFGLFLPVSGEVKAATWVQEIAGVYGGRFDPAYLVSMAQYIPAILGMLLIWIIRPFLLISPAAQYLLVLAVIGLALILVRYTMKHRIRFNPSFWALLGMTLAGLTHIYAFLWQLGPVAATNPWYYAFEFEVAVLWMAAAVSFVFNRYPYRPLRLAISGSIAFAWMLAIVLLPRTFYDMLNLEPSLYSFRKAAEAVDAHVPTGARIGAFNAGVLGYFTTSTVINLDGLMGDKERLLAIRDGVPLREYLTQHHIDYVADYTRTPAGGRLWGLAPEEYAVVFGQPFRDEYNQMVHFYLLRFTPN